MLSAGFAPVRSKPVMVMLLRRPTITTQVKYSLSLMTLVTWNLRTSAEILLGLTDGLRFSAKILRSWQYPISKILLPP